MGRPRGRRVWLGQETLPQQIDGLRFGQLPLHPSAESSEALAVPSRAYPLRRQLRVTALKPCNEPAIIYGGQRCEARTMSMQSCSQALDSGPTQGPRALCASAARREYGPRDPLNRQIAWAPPRERGEGDRSAAGSGWVGKPCHNRPDTLESSYCMSAHPGEESAFHPAPRSASAALPSSPYPCDPTHPSNLPAAPVS